MNGYIKNPKSGDKNYQERDKRNRPQKNKGPNLLKTYKVKTGKWAL